MEGGCTHSYLPPIKRFIICYLRTITLTPLFTHFYKQALSRTTLNYSQGNVFVKQSSFLLNEFILFLYNCCICFEEYNAWISTYNLDSSILIDFILVNDRLLLNSREGYPKNIGLPSFDYALKQTTTNFY
jgi:hypothetical protein